MKTPISEVSLMDCMEGMKEYPDKYFDLCVTDPPYGVDLEYNTYDDTLENWHNLMLKWIPEITRISRMVVMPCCSINKLPWIYNNFPPDWIMAWVKGSPGHRSYIGFNDWEPLIVYGKLNECHFHDVIRINNNVKMGEFGHPCPKPVKWFEWFYHRIKKLESPKVIDPFLGSGSSRIAARNLGFDFVGYELDKEYYDAQEKRFKNHISQPRLQFEVEQIPATQESLFGDK